MTHGKSISLFLIDGTASGVIACELFNWTGKGYKIPRNQLKTMSEREDLKKAGVYFLIGHDPETDQPMAYIGEAEEVYKRISQHQDTDFWTEVIAITSKDENLNKAHVKYLEYTLYQSAIQAARYAMHNKNTPNKPAISEADQAVMLEFAENMKLMVGTLGHRVFEPLVTSKRSVHEYQIQAARGANARGVQTSEGFVVLKGSRVAASEVPSTPEYVKRKRAALAADGSIEELTLTRDVLFNSPSLAAAVVQGRSANGLVEWKRPNGTTLRDEQLSPPV
jgi:Domain of unknown function (DUF4357)